MPRGRVRSAQVTDVARALARVGTVPAVSHAGRGPRKRRVALSLVSFGFFRFGVADLCIVREPRCLEPERAWPGAARSVLAGAASRWLCEQSAPFRHLAEGKRARRLTLPHLARSGGD